MTGAKEARTSRTSFGGPVPGVERGGMALVSRQQFNRYAFLCVIVGFALGVPLRIHGFVAGYLLFFLAACVAIFRIPIASWMTARENFAERYGSYETLRARAPEVVDYELLFHVRDQRGRRGALRFLKHHLPGIPRPYAERFVDDLGEDDRPQGLPDEPDRLSGRLPGDGPSAGRSTDAGGTP